MNQLRKLYKITAYWASKQETYYVVGWGTSCAEDQVCALHKKEGWPKPDYFSSDTVAEESSYGKPSTLILSQ